MNGLLPCCSDALITRVVLILTTAGDAFSIMSAKELESWLDLLVAGIGIGPGHDRNRRIGARGHRESRDQSAADRGGDKR